MIKKTGFPEEGELLLCTVTKIFGHSVFVNIEEYGRSGMVHISEISPGRIRNLRDYVVEGKKIVCAVLRVNKEKGHVDLSLRRVNEGQRRKKLEQIKQEQKTFIKKKINSLKI
jgi:translation initiation factor 2 subunit 1